MVKNIRVMGKHRTRQKSVNECLNLFIPFIEKSLSNEKPTLFLNPVEPKTHGVTCTSGSILKG